MIAGKRHKISINQVYAFGVHLSLRIFMINNIIYGQMESKNRGGNHALPDSKPPFKYLQQK
jgi:hypothetical protein